MSQKRYSTEKIIGMLQEADVALSRGEKVGQVCRSLGISERRACRIIGQCRSTQRLELVLRDDEKLLRAEIIRLARKYGRYGYRRITALLRNAGWQANHKRVERIWHQERG